MKETDILYKSLIEQIISDDFDISLSDISGYINILSNISIPQIVVIDNATGNEHDLAYNKSIVPNYLKSKHYDVEVIYIGDNKYKVTYRTSSKQICAKYGIYEDTIKEYFKKGPNVWVDKQLLPKYYNILKDSVKESLKIKPIVKNNIR